MSRRPFATVFSPFRAEAVSGGRLPWDFVHGYMMSAAMQLGIIIACHRTWRSFACVRSCCAVALIISLQLMGCGRTVDDRQSNEEAEDAPAIAAVESKPVKMRETITYELAIYFLPAPSADPISQLRQLLGRESSMFRQADEVGEDIQESVVAAYLGTDLKEYRPPDVGTLKYCGRGLTLEECEKLQSTEHVLILNFAYPRQHVWTGLKASHHLIHDLALSCGGLIWDEATREVFTPQAWEDAAWPMGREVRLMSRGTRRFILTRQTSMCGRSRWEWRNLDCRTS